MKFQNAGVMERFVQFAAHILHRSALTLNPEWFLRQDESLTRVASPATCANIILGVTAATAIGIKSDSLQVFAVGLLWAVSVAALFYVATAGTRSCRRVVGASKTVVAGRDMLDALAILVLLGAATVSAYAVYTAIQNSSLTPLLNCTTVVIALLLSLCLLLHPSLIGIEISPLASAGEEALSVALLLMKCLARQAGMLCGSLSVLGALALGRATWTVLASRSSSEMLIGRIELLAGVTLVLYGLLLPVILYLAYICLALFADLARAVLKQLPENQ